jgi:hypothetical protein
MKRVFSLALVFVSSAAVFAEGTGPISFLGSYDVNGFLPYDSLGEAPSQAVIRASKAFASGASREAHELARAELQKGFSYPAMHLFCCTAIRLNARKSAFEFLMSGTIPAKSRSSWSFQKRIAYGFALLTFTEWGNATQMKSRDKVLGQLAGKKSKAIQDAIQSLFAVSEADAPIRLLAAYRAGEESRLGDRRKILKSLVKDFPNVTSLKVQLAGAYFAGIERAWDQTGKPMKLTGDEMPDSQKAFGLLEEVLQGNPKQVNALVMKGQELLARGEETRARAAIALARSQYIQNRNYAAYVGELYKCKPGPDVRLLGIAVNKKGYESLNW